MRFLLCFLSLSLVLGSCYKDVDNTVEEIITEVPKSSGNGDLNGKVIDASGAILSGYTIVIDDQSYEVTQPYFNLINVNIRKEGQLVQIIKDNELVATSYVYLLENDFNKIELTTFKRQATQALPPNQQLNLNLSSTISIDFSRAIVGSSDISVSSFEVEPQCIAESFGVSAYNREGQLLALNPVLGFGVELREGGRVKPVEVGGVMQFSLAGQVGKGLFRYDEAVGYWLMIEEIGALPVEVLQKGCFMVADYESGVYVEGTTITQDMPVSYMNAKLDYTDKAFFTTEQGRWAGVFPVGLESEVDFTDPCGDIIMTHTFEYKEGQLEEQVDLNNHPQLFQVTTTLIDCDGGFLTMPGIQVQSNESESLHLFSHAQVNNWIAVCVDDASIAAYNLESDYTSGAIDWSSAIEDELGYLTACEALESGFSFIEINGEQQVLEAFNYQYTGDKSILSSSSDDFRISFKGDMTGTYATNEVNISIDKSDFGKDGYYISCEQSTLGCGIESLNVTHLMTIEEGWIRVSFEGILWMQTIRNPTADNYSIKGVILIKT